MLSSRVATTVEHEDGCLDGNDVAKAAVRVRAKRRYGEEQKTDQLPETCFISMTELRISLTAIVGTSHDMVSVSGIPDLLHCFQTVILCLAHKRPQSWLSCENLSRSERGYDLWERCSQTCPKRYKQPHIYDGW